MTRRTLASLLLASFLVLTVAPSYAAAALGVVDVQRIFKEYKKTEGAQSQIHKEEDAFKKEVEKAQAKVTKAREANKSQAEIEKLSKEIEAQLTPQREKLYTLTGQLTSELQHDIVAAVTDVSKKLGMDTVLDKQVVITGGVDITDMVISRLNQGK